MSGALKPGGPRGGRGEVHTALAGASLQSPHLSLLAPFQALLSPRRAPRVLQVGHPGRRPDRPLPGPAARAGASARTSRARPPLQWGHPRARGVPWTKRLAVLGRLGPRPPCSPWTQTRRRTSGGLWGRRGGAGRGLGATGESGRPPQDASRLGARLTREGRGGGVVSGRGRGFGAGWCFGVGAGRGALQRVAKALGVDPSRAGDPGPPKPSQNPRGRGGSGDGAGGARGGPLDQGPEERGGASVEAGGGRGRARGRKQRATPSPKPRLARRRRPTSASRWPRTARTGPSCGRCRHAHGPPPPWGPSPSPGVLPLALGS